MSTRIFSKKQIKDLLENPNVENCGERSIGYSRKFKLAAVKQWQAGVSPRQIFVQAGFNLRIIGEGKPKDCLSRWRKIFKKSGEEGLRIDGRGRSKSGGRPKSNWSNDKEKIKYLETKIAYLKAENRFLAKLRKKR